MSEGRTDVGQGPTAAGLALRALARYGEARAFTGHGGELTYAQALDLVARYQAVYAKLGVARGQRIALLTANRADTWLASIAASALGQCTTSLHPLGSLEDHLFALKDGKADYLIVDVNAYAARGGELSVRADGLRQIFTVGPADYGVDLLAKANDIGAASPRVLAQPGDMATLGYTGGTTGTSKGATRRHASVVAMTNAVLADFEWPSCPTYLSVAPISHVGGTKLTPTLLRGGRIHLHHGFEPRPVPSESRIAEPAPSRRRQKDDPSATRRPLETRR